MATKRVFRRLPTDLFEQPIFVSLQEEEQLLLIWLILKADDYGRGNKANHDDPSVITLENAGYLHLYTLGEKEYYSLPHWQRWQHIEAPRPSNIPAPQEGK